MKTLVVLDVKTGEPVDGATVYIDGQPKGATNDKGVYALPDGEGVIKITHVNYQPEQFETAGSINQVIRLIPKDSELPDIIITAVKNKEKVFIVILIVFVIALLFYYRKKLFK